MPYPTKTTSPSPTTWASGRSAQATKSSRNASVRVVPARPHTSEGCGVRPTSATGWKYEWSGPAGSRTSASNTAAMYWTARRPPRVAGARPSSKSSARYLRCASTAAVLMGGSGGPAGVGVGAGWDGPGPQANDAITTSTDHLQDVMGAPIVGGGPS